MNTDTFDGWCFYYRNPGRKCVGECVIRDRLIVCVNCAREDAERDRDNHRGRAAAHGDLLAPVGGVDAGQ